ncbi:MAG: hypothetical protein WDN26_11630 [Chitinophagaceae bacterium]
MDIDEYGHEKKEALVNKYTFMDLRKKSYYEYANFSDTAAINDKYLHPSSGKSKDGWHFFSEEDVIDPENREFITDTIINGVKYKRAKSFSIVNGTSGEEKIIKTGYFRCDKKETFFSMDKPLSRIVGYPMLRLDSYSPSTQIALSQEIEFISDKLTAKELKVFEAWEKNAKENPINKNSKEE